MKFYTKLKYALPSAYIYLTYSAVHFVSALLIFFCRSLNMSYVFHVQSLFDFYFSPWKAFSRISSPSSNAASQRCYRWHSHYSLSLKPIYFLNTTTVCHYTVYFLKLFIYFHKHKNGSSVEEDIVYLFHNFISYT